MTAQPGTAPGPLTRVELLDVMEHLRVTLAEDGAWRFMVILVPADVDGPVLLGSDGARAWTAPRAEPMALRGVDFRSLVDNTHAVQLDAPGPVLVFGVLESGPVASRLRAVKGTASLKRVASAVEDALARVVARRTHHAARRAGPGTPHEHCELCHPLDEHGQPRAARTSLYRVLGAPLFHDHGSRGWCIKECPACRTRFGWVAGYTYLVNGATEDEESLHVLRGEEEARWLDAVDLCVSRGAVSASPP